MNDQYLIRTQMRIDRKELGDMLREAREMNSMSVPSASLMSDIDEGTIHRIEAGRANAGIDVINTLCALYGVKLKITKL